MLNMIIGYTFAILFLYFIVSIFEMVRVYGTDKRELPFTIFWIVDKIAERKERRA